MANEPCLALLTSSFFPLAFRSFLQATALCRCCFRRSAERLRRRTRHPRNSAPRTGEGRAPSHLDTSNWAVHLNEVRLDEEGSHLSAFLWNYMKSSKYQIVSNYFTVSNWIYKQIIKIWHKNCQVLAVICQTLIQIVFLKWEKIIKNVC